MPSPVREVDEEVGAGRQGQIGDIVGEHKEEDEDPVAQVKPAHSVSLWLPLAFLGFQIKFGLKLQKEMFIVLSESCKLCLSFLV